MVLSLPTPQLDLVSSLDLLSSNSLSSSSSSPQQPISHMFVTRNSDTHESSPCQTAVEMGLPELQASTREGGIDPIERSDSTLYNC